jgi:hypothetical protein
MPTLSGRRRVSGTAKHFGNFAANTEYDRLASRALFRHSPRPRVWVYLHYISRQSCDGFGDKRPARPDAGVADNTLIFTKPQALG